MIFLVGFLAAVAVLYSSFALFLYFRQRSLQYRPTHKDVEGRGTPELKPWRDTGGKLLGYYRKAAEPRRAVLFFHGSGGEALDRAWVSELVSDKDLLLLAEYPGYGGRSGHVSEATLLADSESLVDEVQKAWGPIPLVVVGEGLGSHLATYLASRKQVDRLALISPFASGQQVAARKYPLFPVKWLMRDKFSTLDYVKTIEVPLQVIHGTLDEFVPLEFGKAVFHAYSGKQKEFHEIPGFGHSNLPDAILHSPFSARFREFVAN